MRSTSSPCPGGLLRPSLWLALALATAALVGLAPLPSADAAQAKLPWLTVSGNRIVTAGTGQDVVLRGANVLRSEWDMRMDAERRAIPALASWKGNVIVRGFASDPVNAGDAAYLGMLDEHVALAAAHRMYVVFSWRSHAVNGLQPPMPDDRAQQALAALAKRYSTKPNVMYALQVEPHDVSWAQLQPRFVQMVDAIRAAASPSKPIVMVPGTSWGRDVSGALTLPVNRENIVYKTHPYNSSGLFQRQFLDTYNAGKAVFIGEYGYLPEHGMHMPDVRALINVARTHGLGWAAWLFDYQGGPSLVVDNTTWAATSPYGTTVRKGMVDTPPVPSTAPSTTTTVNDNTTGGSPGQFSYAGSWRYATGSPTKHAQDDHYSDVVGSTSKLRFSGTQAVLYGSRAPWHGTALVSVDGGPQKMIDYYAATRQDGVRLYATPRLKAGEHVLTITVHASRNAGSTGGVVTVDRVDVTR